MMESPVNIITEDDGIASEYNHGRLRNRIAAEWLLRFLFVKNQLTTAPDRQVVSIETFVGNDAPFSYIVCKLRRECSHLSVCTS